MGNNLHIWSLTERCLHTTCAGEGIFPVEVAMLPGGDCVAPIFMSPKLIFCYKFLIILFIESNFWYKTVSREIVLCRLWSSSDFSDVVRWNSLGDCEKFVYHFFLL